MRHILRAEICSREQIRRDSSQQARLSRAVLAYDAELFGTAQFETNVPCQQTLTVRCFQFRKGIVDHRFSLRHDCRFAAETEEDCLLLLRHFGHLRVFFFKALSHGFYHVHLVF